MKHFIQEFAPDTQPNNFLDFWNVTNNPLLTEINWHKWLTAELRKELSSQLPSSKDSLKHRAWDTWWEQNYLRIQVLPPVLFNFKKPKTEETLSRRKMIFFKLLHFGIERYKLQNQIDQILNDFFSEKIATTHPRIVEFIGALFCSNAGGPASADKLLKISKDVFWILRFFYLIQYDKGAFTEEEFISSMSPGKNEQK